MPEFVPSDGVTFDELPFGAGLSWGSSESPGILGPFISGAESIEALGRAVDVADGGVASEGSGSDDPLPTPDSMTDLSIDDEGIDDEGTDVETPPEQLPEGHDGAAGERKTGRIDERL